MPTPNQDDESSAARLRVSAELRQSARPDVSFFLLVVLSCVIATMGLILDSVAVIVGAMLVAPLMSPIMAVSLASLGRRPGLMRMASVSLVAGVALAIALSAALAWVARELPFNALVNVPREVESRTAPNPFDLVIALAGGAAGAYSLARLKGSTALPGVAIATALMPPLCTAGIGFVLGDSEYWGGALLLFLTNLVAIVFAGVAVFFVLGLQPKRSGPAGPRLLAQGLLVAVIAVPLVVLGLRSAQESREADRVNAAVEHGLETQFPGAKLLEVTRSSDGPTLRLTITARIAGTASIEDARAVQALIAQRLQRRVAVVFIAVPILELDPLNPPPPRATVTVEATATPARPSMTPAPSPTATITPSPTPVPTVTPTPGPTSPGTGNAGLANEN